MNKIASHLDFHAQALMLRSRRNEILADQIKKHAPGIGPLEVTHSRHLATAINVGRDKILFRDPINPSMDGNTVELAVEQMEFSENTMRYQTTLNFLNSRITGLMSAIRGE